MGTKRVGWARIRSLINENSGSFHFQVSPTVARFDLGGQVQTSMQSDGSVTEGAAGETNYWTFRCGNQLAAVAIGTQTLLGPAVSTSGLDISGDAADNDGWELRGMSSLQMGRLNKDYFTVGTSPAFYARCKFSIADISDTDDLRFGFTQADEAFTATTADYTDAAWIVLNDGAGDVRTRTILANAGTVVTDLDETDWANAATHEWEIRVSGTGVTTYYVDGTLATDTVAYTFADGTKVTPMWYHRLAASSSPGIVWNLFEFGLQQGKHTNAATSAGIL